MGEAPKTGSKEPAPEKPATQPAASTPAEQKAAKAAAAPAAAAPPPSPAQPLKVEGEDDHDLTGEMVAVVSASRDKTLRVWRMHDGFSVHHLIGHINKVAAVAALSHGRVASGSEDGDVKVWNIITGKEEASFATNGNILSLEVAFGGRGVVTGHGSSQEVKNAVQLFMLDSPKQRRWGVEDLPSIVQAVAFVPECDVVASAGNDNKVRLWDGVSGASRAELEGHTGWVRCLAPLPRSRLASGADDGGVRLWDAASGAQLAVLEQAHGGSNMFGLCGLPNGQLATAGGDKTLRLWQAKEGTHDMENVAEYVGHASAVYAVAAAKVPRIDGKGTHIVLVSGGHDRSVRVWDIETKECKVCVDDHQGWVLNVAIAPLTW